MARSRNPRVYIEGDADGVKRATKDAERALGNMSRVATSSFGALKLGAIGAAAAIGGVFAIALKTGIDELLEAEKIGARTANVLKTTGGAANVTRKEIEGLAAAIERKTGIDGDAVQAAENLLLTFTNIRNEAGKGNDVFTQATRITTDLSVAFDQDLSASAIQVGKALDNPIKGVTALSKVGVSFTQQQRDQIKALQESGRTLEAQKIILRALETQVGGAGDAFGKTLPGKIERAKRAWESTTTVLAASFLPVLERVTTGLLDNQDKVEAVMRGIAGAVDGMVQFVGAVIDGDWQRAWKLAQAGAGKALRAIGELAKRVLLPLAEQAGEAIARGLANGLDRGLAKLPGSGALRRILGFGSAGDNTTLLHLRVLLDVESRLDDAARVVIDNLDDFATSVTPATPRRRGRGRAAGGWVNGPGDPHVDSQAILARPDEVILNPEQQRLIDSGMPIADAVRRTGGAPRRYGAGGWVHPAPGTRRGGGPGQGTHSYSADPNNWQSDTAYDLMGSDGTPVYAAHAGVISGTRPFNSDGRFWGMAAYLNVPGGQFYYKHLKRLAVKAGQTVQAGDLIGYLGTGVNGGPHLHLGATSRSLLEKAVNAGRGDYSTGGATGDEPDEGPEPDETDADLADVDVWEIRNRAGEITAWRTSDGRTIPNRGKRGRAARAAAARTARQRVGAERTGRRLLGMRPTGTGETYRDRIAGIGRDDSLQDRQAGDAAEASARAAGVENPEKLAAIRQLAVNRQRKQDLDRILSELRAEEDRVGGRIGRLEAGKRSWFAALRKARTPARRAECLDRIRELNRAIGEAQDELRGVQYEIADVVVQLRELGYDTQVAEATVASAPDRTPGSGADGGTPVAGPAPLSPADQALVDRGIANEDFLRTVFGPGDLGMGGQNAWSAASPRWVTLRVDRDSLGSAVGASIDGQGGVPATVVPSGA